MYLRDFVVVNLFNFVDVLVSCHSVVVTMLRCSSAGIKLLIAEADANCRLVPLSSTHYCMAFTPR